MEYLTATKAPSKRMMRRIVAVVVGVSLLGMALYFARKINNNEPVLLPVRLERTFLSFTVLLVFTHSRQFSRTLHTFVMTLAAVMPYVLTMCTTAMVFGLFCVDMFAGKGIVGYLDGKEHFPDFGHSIATMFRLFVGEGWHLIFYDVAWKTSHATMFLFMAYRFFSGLLIGQLLIGVVITVYNEVTEIAARNSIRVYDAVEPMVRNLRMGDRDALIEDFVYLNWRLFDVHCGIERLSKLSQLQARILNADAHFSGGEEPVSDVRSIMDSTTDGPGKDKYTSRSAPISAPADVIVDAADPMKSIQVTGAMPDRPDHDENGSREALSLNVMDISANDSDAMKSAEGPDPMKSAEYPDGMNSGGDADVMLDGGQGPHEMVSDASLPFTAVDSLASRPNTAQRGCCTCAWV